LAVVKRESKIHRLVAEGRTGITSSSSCRSWMVADLEEMKMNLSFRDASLAQVEESLSP